MTIKDLLKSPHLIYVVLLTGFISFAPSLFNEYNLDDHLYNHDRHDGKAFFTAVSDIFSQPTFLEYDGVKHEYRPVPALVFYLERTIFGESPFAGHAINLLLYLLILGGIWKFCHRRLDDANRIVLFLTLMLFAVHPLHSEVVASIKNRDELIVMVFGLLSMASLYEYSKSGRGVSLVLMLVCFLLSCLSKKSGLLFLPVMMLFYWIWSDKQARNYLIVFGGLAITTALFIYFHDTLEMDERELIYYENELISARYGWSERLATGFAVIWRYISIFFVPWPLSSYYGFPVVKIMTFGSWQAIAGLLAFAGMTIGGLRLLYEKRWMGACLLSLAGSLLAISNIIELIPGMFGERLMFLPSLFLSVAVGWAISRLMVRNYKVVAAAFPVIVAGLTLLSFQRSTEWKNHQSLYEADIAAHPDNLKLRLELHAYYLSKALSAESDAEKNDLLLKVREHIYKAAALAPDDQGILASKYQAGCMTGDESVCAGNPNPLKFKMLADHFTSVTDTAKTIEYLEKHLAVYPDDKQVYQTLNRLYFRSGNRQKGFEILKKAIDKFPASPLGYAEMANYHLSEKDTLAALPFIEKAAVLPPKNRAVIQFLINFYRDKNAAQARKYELLMQQDF